MNVMHADAGNLYGGIETLLVALARFREACPGMDPEFALCYEGRLANELNAAGVPVHMMDAVRLRYPGRVRAMRHRMRALLGQRRTDVMICHGPWAHVLFAPAARAAGVPSVLWVHAPLRRGSWLDQWVRLRPPSLVIYVSAFIQSLAAGFFRAGVPQVCFSPPLIETRVPPETVQRERLRASLQTAPDDVVIIQASRMERWKGQHLLLEALADLMDLPGWSCWIAGAAQRPREIAYERELRAFVIARGLQSRVRFLGQRGDVATLMRCADIYSQPNLSPEPFGIAFVEAMAANLPVVASASGGTLEIVADCGRLVPPGDRAALSRELRRLIGDGAARRELGSRGAARVRTLCGAAQQMAALERLLSGVIRPPAYPAAPSRSGYPCARGGG